MPFLNYGYNGVLDIHKQVIDRLLAQLYEKNMVVSKGGTISDEEFIPIDLGTLGEKRVIIYLRIYDKPQCDFSPSAIKSNVVNIRIPFQLAIWTGVEYSIWGMTFNDWDEPYVTTLDLGLTDIPIFMTNNPPTIHPDCTNIQPEQFHLYSSGEEKELDDTFFDTMLLLKGGKIKWSDLRAMITARIRQEETLKNLNISMPSVDNITPQLKTWDLKIISQAKKMQPPPTYDGVDILLYESAKMGKGIEGDAGNTIPQGPQPPYNFALSINKSVFEKMIEDRFDRTQGYFKQCDTINTPDNPYGWLIVSSDGQPKKYDIPPPFKGKQQKITVNAPLNGQVQVIIPKGGFSPNGRFNITNIDFDQKDSFVADENGAANVSVTADAGNKLSIETYAVSIPGQENICIWRPEITLQAGQLLVTFHYYAKLATCVSAEGEGKAVIALSADKSQPFAVSSKIVSFDLEYPWWVHAAGFLLELLTGGLSFGITGGVLNSALASILVETVGLPQITDYAASKMSPYLQQSFLMPIPGHGLLAPFLDQLDLYKAGIVLSCHADAGCILSYGRKAIPADYKGKFQLGSKGNALQFTFGVQPNSIEVNNFFDYVYVMDGDKFWELDDSTCRTQQFESSSATIDITTPQTVLSKLGEGVTKVLVERSLNENKPTFTWITYLPRVWPSVEIQNHVSKIATTNKTGFLYQTTFSYKGWLEVATTKFFRTQVTKQAHKEHWYWDNVEVLQNQPIVQPGINISWDAKADRLLVDVDQTQFVDPMGGVTGGVQLPPSHHEVKYDCYDVFGTHLSATLDFDMPTYAVSINKPKKKGAFHDSLPDPMWRQGHPKRELPPPPHPVVPRPPKRR